MPRTGNRHRVWKEKKKKRQRKGMTTERQPEVGNLEK